ncbi:MAG TPA: methyl-accepting chemotaxis protein [Treponemataceae bacterium]|nr:methyl-accepting chemotaxis protein [Treponemataceae bacterium]
MENIELIQSTASVISALQKERGLSSIYAGSGAGKASVNAQRIEVDKAIEALIPFVERTTYLPFKIQDLQASIQKNRDDINSGKLNTFEEVIDTYTLYIRSLMTIQNKAVNQPTTGGLGKVMASIALLQEAAEGAARARGLMGGILSANVRISNQDVMLSLIRDFESIEINLTSPASIYTTESKATIETLLSGSDYNLLKNTLMEIFIRFASETSIDSYSSSFTTVWDSGTQFVDSLGTILNIELLSLIDRSVAVRSNYAKDFFWSFIVIFVLIVALLLIGIRFAVRIQTPIKQVTSTFKSISEGEGDLSVELIVSDKAELGLLASHFNNFTARLSNLIQGIRNETRVLMNLGEDLRTGMQQTASAAEEISATLRSIQENVVHQSASVTESSATLDQFLGNISELNGLIESQSSAVTESTASIRQMLTTIQTVQTILETENEKIAGLVRFSAEGTERLDPLIAQIKMITQQSKSLQEANTLISGIASQTNLLAMNAAIEAAHAGEHGKGFAVVADEIRKLAENSAQQTKGIEANLKSIQTVIDTVVASSVGVKDSFDQISTGISNMSAERVRIREAMDEQQVASREVMVALDEITTVTSSVSDFASETESGSREIKTEMNNLMHITEVINSSVKETSMAVDDITRVTLDMAELSENNHRSIESIYNNFSSFKLKDS